MGQMAKNLPATVGDPGLIPWAGKTPWRREVATHSSILAWRIPQTEEPGGATVPGIAELERTEGLTLPLHILETITRTVFCSWDRTRGLRSP